MNYDELRDRHEKKKSYLLAITGEEKAQKTFEKIAGQIAAQFPTASNLLNRGIVRVTRTKDKTMYMECCPDFYQWINIHLPELNRLLEEKYPGYRIEWGD